MILRRGYLTRIWRESPYLYFCRLSLTLCRSWKTQAQAQISQLQAAVAALLQREKLPELASFKTDIPILKATSTSPADSALGSVSNVAIAPIDMRVSRHPSP